MNPPPQNPKTRDRRICQPSNVARHMTHDTRHRALKTVRRRRFTHVDAFRWVFWVTEVGCISAMDWLHSQRWLPMQKSEFHPSAPPLSATESTRPQLPTDLHANEKRANEIFRCCRVKLTYISRRDRAQSCCPLVGPRAAFQRCRRCKRKGALRALKCTPTAK